MSDVLFDATLGGLTLKQIMSGSYQSGAQAQQRYASGGVTPQAIYGRAADPRFQFTSADIAGIIGGISPQVGLAVTSGITVPFRKAANGSTFESGSSHFASACTNGLVIVESITASQQGDGATAQLTVHCRSTDGSDPVTPSTGNALGSEAFNAEYDLGPVVLTPNGVTAFELDIAGFTVNTGIEVDKRRIEGYPFPVKIFIRRQAPTIDLQFYDFDAVAAILSTYKQLDAVAAYLMKKKDGSTHEADASTVHVKFSFAAGLITMEGLEASEANDGQATLKLHGKSLTWSASNALP